MFERIAVHQSWKKTNLLCENSVKNIHSNTAKLLQQYAIHDYTDNDLNSFPGSLQRASAFFSVNSSFSVFSVLFPLFPLSVHMTEYQYVFLCMLATLIHIHITEILKL